MVRNSARDRARIACLLLLTFALGLVARVAVPVRPVARVAITAELHASSGHVDQHHAAKSSKRHGVWRAHHAPLVLLSRLPSLEFATRATWVAFEPRSYESRSPENDSRPPC